jgi:hypothetical protein
VNRIRALLVLLLCLSLPGWAVAGQWQDIGCPHHGFGAAAQPHHHDGGKGCAEQPQCRCSHHGAGGAGAVALGGGMAGPLVFAGPGLIASDYAGRPAQAHASFPFRPPIAAPAGAA